MNERQAVLIHHSALRLPHSDDMTDPRPSDEISTMLAERIEAGDFPSAVYVVAERGRVRFADALGDAVRDPGERPATLETIYDLASLTKPLVTGLLAAMHVERGALELDGRVSQHLEEFDTEDKRAITLR